MPLNRFLKTFYLFVDSFLTPQASDTKKAEFSNIVDLHEVAHNKSPHLDLHCLPSSL